MIRVIARSVLLALLPLASGCFLFRHQPEPLRGDFIPVAITSPTGECYPHVFESGETRRVQAKGYYFMNNYTNDPKAQEIDADGKHVDGRPGGGVTNGFPRWATLYYWADSSGRPISARKLAGTVAIPITAPVDDARLCLLVNDDKFDDNLQGTPPLTWRVF